jgi:hypothetical protein
VARKSDDAYYSRGSVHQFLSGENENFRKKNASWAIWTGHSGRHQGCGYGWYDDICFVVIKAIVARVFESGGTLKEMSLPVGRSLLQNMIESLSKLGDQDSLEVCAFLLVFNFVTVGRAAEAALSSWNAAFYHINDSCAVLYCPMAKVNTAKRLSMYNDAKLFQLDPYFLVSCYRIIGGGKRHMTANGLDFQQKEHWIFPSIALKSNPLKLLNEKIRETCGPRNGGSASLAGSYYMTSLRDSSIS